MAKIFISYDRASKDVVEQLVQDLTDDDHEVWFDQHLTGGQKWWDNILSQIRQSEVFVAALTPASLESRACQREMNYARDLQRILVPVRLSDKVSPDSLPPDLSELQWVDYSHADKQALKSLQRTLRRLPNAPPLPDPLPSAPPVPISYLSSLRAKVEADSQLPLQDQIQLVFELREQIRKGEPAKEIIDLLQRVKNRDDLFARVSQDIEDLQREISGVEAVQPPAVSNFAAHPIVRPPVTPPQSPAVEPPVTPREPLIGGILRGFGRRAILSWLGGAIAMAVVAIGIWAAANMEADRSAAQKAAELAEADRKAAAAAQSEADRVAAERTAKAEADRVAAEKAAKAEADRRAAEKAETERKAAAELKPPLFNIESDESDSRAAPAQQTPQGPVKNLVPTQNDWTKVCGRDRTNKDICYTRRDFGLKRGEAPVLALAVYDVNIIRLLVPTGFKVRPGFRFAIDKGPSREGAFEICFKNGCFAEAKVSGTIIDQLKEGSTMTATVKNQTNNEVTFVIPLTGFGVAYDGPPIDPKVLEEQQKRASTSGSK